jgi:hypothetical protein
MYYGRNEGGCTPPLPGGNMVGGLFAPGKKPVGGRGRGGGGIGGRITGGAPGYHNPCGYAMVGREPTSLFSQ